MNPVICTTISKMFGRVQALNTLDLTIRAGEIMALLGPSGCGKTTVLRLIAGFEQPDTGQIVIGDQVVASPSRAVAPEHRQVGMVFQHYALFPHLSVADNVGFGVRGSERAARARAMLDLVGLSGLEARMPHELSGGQQQRVALARALAPRPAVLLLDEPFSNLDADLRALMRVQVRDILKQVGTTALFVTHDQDEALFMGDRVALMRAGRLAQVDSPQALYLAPASPFVAEFLGHAMFLPARAAADGLHTEIGFVPQPLNLPPATRVAVVARPDDLLLTAAPEHNGQIVGRAFRGGEYVYDVRLASQQVVRCACNHVHDYPPGTPVRVTLAPGHALAWFPQADIAADSEA